MKSRKISAEVIRRRYLERLHEHLAKADADRLDVILPLLDSSDTVSVAACMTALYPKRQQEDAQAQLRAFRKRLADAARSAGLRLTLEVDTHKRLAAAQRRCWFEAEDDVVEEVRELSACSADLDRKSFVEPQAVATTGEALEANQRSIGFFVCAAEADQNLAQSLLKELKQELKPSKSYGYDLWDQSSILTGENRNQEAEKAFQRAVFIVVLVSPALLGDAEHCQWLDRAKAEGKLAFPVVLRSVDEIRHDLRGLRGDSLLSRDGHSYEDCSTKQRTALVRKLFQDIEQRLDARFAAKPTVQHRRKCDPEELRELGRRESPIFVDTRASAISLEVQEIDTRALANLNENAQPALDMLEAWALDEKGPLFSAVLGEYGIGKTTTLQELTHRLLDRRQRHPETPLPIFIDLRAYMPSILEHKVPSLEDLLGEILQHPWKVGHPVSLAPQEILRLVREDGALLILDGLDEKLVHLDEATGRAFVRTLWGALPAHLHRKGLQPAPAGHRVGKLLFSCRSHYFKTIRDQGAFFRAEGRDDVRSADYRACVLLPFTEEQVRKYLGGILHEPARVDAAIELFSQVHNLQELSRRPYLLSLIVPQIARLEVKRAQGEPVLGVTLYETLVEEWLSRDAGKHYIHKEDKRRLMEDVALAMWRAGAHEWPWDELRQWLGRRVALDPVLAARYLGDSRKAALLDEDFRTATLVLRPDTSADGFRFAHTSLHEFFLACSLVRALVEGREDAWQLPMPSTESLEFLGQLLAAERRTERRDAAGHTLRRLLAQYHPQATKAAFRYWLLAVEHDLPEPEPGHADLRGADLSGWKIAGRSPGRQLSLRGADLTGARLRESQWHWVDISEARLDHADLWRAELRQVRAHAASLAGADLRATVWRGCACRDLRGAAEARRDQTSFVDCEVDVESLGSDFVTQGSWSRCRSGGVFTTAPDARELGARLHLNLGHGSYVSDCAFSPDGSRILSCSSDNTLKLWDATSGLCLATLQGHTSLVCACAFSPDGSRIVSASSDNTLKLWDAASGLCLATLQGHSSCVTDCAFSPDGSRILSGSFDNTLKLWDAATGLCLTTLQGHTSSVFACTFSPDGSRVVSVSNDDTLRLWDATSGLCLAIIQYSGVRSCAFSPDGSRILSGSFDRTLKLWDATSGLCLTTLQGHASAITSCAFSPDGSRILSGSYDSTLRLWDAASGSCLATIRGWGQMVMACTFSPDGSRILFGTFGGNLLLLDTASGLLVSVFRRRSLSSSARVGTFSPDGSRILSSSDDTTLKLWDVASGCCLATLQGHRGYVYACAFSPDGSRILSGSNDSTLRLWDVASGRCLATLQAHNSVNACTFSPDGSRILSGSDDSTLRLWDAASGLCLATLQGHGAHVRACAFSPDGSRILSGSDDSTLRLWDAASGLCLATLQGHGTHVRACAFSPDGSRILSGSSDSTLKLWDAASGLCLATFQGHASDVVACAFSREGSRILSASDDSTLKLWDAASGLCLATLQGHGALARGCPFSPDGSRILSVFDDSTLKLWDTASGQELLTFACGPNHQYATLDLAQQRIVSASPEAWRFLAWQYYDKERGTLRLLPADHFAPLPSGAAAAG